MLPVTSMTDKHFEDDGRVIADMSGVQRRRLWLPVKDSEAEDTRPWDESGKWNRRERKYALWGALSASLLIGLVYLAGFGIVIFLLTLLWR